MSKLVTGVLAIALCVSMASAAEVVKKTEKTEVRQTDHGIVKSKHTETISVTTYRTQVRDAYVAVGVPENIIVKLLPLDVEIYNAWLRGDMVRVRELRAEKVRLLPSDLVPKVETYFQEHPVVVRGDRGEFRVWSNVPETGGAAGTSVRGGELKGRSERTKGTVQREHHMKTGGATQPAPSGGERNLKQQPGTMKNSNMTPGSQKQPSSSELQGQPSSGTTPGQSGAGSGTTNQNAPHGSGSQPGSSY